MDAVRSIFEPELLARLRRENILADTVSGFRMRFADGASVWALFHQTGPAQDEEQTWEWDWQHTQMAVELPSAVRTPGPITAVSTLPVMDPIGEQHLQPFIPPLSMLAREGASWPRTKRSALELKDYLSILPRFQHLFPKNERPHQEAGFKFAAKAGDLSEANGELHQHHGDDLSQSSRVLPEYLPSGWKQIVDLLSWVESCKDDSVCVIDEPERHLHPLLQRALIAELAVLSSRKRLQLIIATHSPSFLNHRAWGRDVAVFHLLGGHIVREPDITAILDQLGCVASDLCQSNGVVWVEGPSDRIYINAFLRAWRSQRAPHKSPLIENVHFSYAFFDGSCLVHFSGLTSPSSSSFNGDDAALLEQVGDGTEQQPEDLIQLLRLNRNAAICIDCDNDFAIDDFGSLIASNTLGRTKLRVSTELAGTGMDPIHITDGYTMECYVAEVMPRGFLQVSAGRVAVGGSKVQFALRFSRLSDSVIATCFERHPGLCNFVRKLDSAIEQWNG
ncbi:ATP-dependent nuclease [Roseateles cellulosilyticus]|uniref:AAA family ATPase n=1 Tax=Pelomonas cellulosilytica TaxID=2906762 RepID=A0ABS8XU74_9BURK|nr:AAA family ATPase [Pelomonas sp. P8]MCE4554249.1 AAA family ATPase [Pelomonas sp. P8]